MIGNKNGLGRDERYNKVNNCEIQQLMPVISQI